ncbi:hypothetical protein IL992_43505 [Microbispora sp. NEAU-D428]|uniref:hypothetical protein n=1 Tax=Microbispora sitophila TaxID=2771537 RepID=UPI001866FDAA|nr:hypothetical protein [Microbispora sitophila]MBE3015973.1 hypothetical protein [Microbispora sitophila]
MPVREAPVVSVPERSGGGLFGGKKRLEAENAQLREWVERLGGLDAMQITAATEQLRAEQARLQAAIQDADHRLREIEAQIVQRVRTPRRRPRLACQFMGAWRTHGRRSHG